MGLFAIDILCANPECKYSTDIIIDREEKDGTWECPSCGADMKRAFLTPPHGTRASYVDGRKNPVMREMIEAARLEAESYNLPPEKRGLINKEIRTLRTPRKK